jgi:hypothetical protein
VKQPHRDQRGAIHWPVLRGEPIHEIRRSLPQLPKGNAADWRPGTWDEKSSVQI